MTKTLRTVKISIVMGVLLFSAFAVLIPSSSAGPLGLVNCNAVLQVEAANSEELTHFPVPLSGPKIIDVKIGYMVTGIFSGPTIARFTEGVPASISLSVEPTADYVTASLSRNVVTIKIEKGWCYATVQLSVTFRQNAPAKGPVDIKIKMEAAPVSGLIWKINGATSEGVIEITPEYLPIISVTPRSTLQEISPGQIAEFPIDLENNGNAQTKFIFDVVDVPEGWSVSIVSNVDIGSAVEGQNNKKTVILSIQPPLGFGYHDDRKDITITVKGVYFAKSGGSNLTTDEFSYIFNVRSRGFSTPGFEAIFVVLALVAVVLIVKIRQKTKKN
jgi:hypothetical protein